MSGDGSQDGDERVLSPDELDIEDEEDVASIGDGRYVIGSDGPPAASESNESGDAPPEPEQPDPTRKPAADPGPAPEAEPAAEPEPEPEPTVTGRDVKEWLGEELASHDSEYAYHIAAKYGDDVTHQQLATDDVGAAFDGLLVWYARQLAGNTPVDEALGILLGESSVQVRYPTSRLVAYLEAHDLGPDDSISDLVSAVSEEDGLAFPRRR
ncbi:DUF7500 family protein [Halobacterium litoreum]|uniref:Flagella protein n=1 Tax=Halobacterium litoreum TaxID=2039234 RepID=A0ABD5NBH0_9EURY|nr:hypothetical protein [Halobacterium litoreum]UHH12005.1 hypothetical protein LT972_07525 [Halobacterium litoreum]